MCLHHRLLNKHFEGQTFGAFIQRRRSIFEIKFQKQVSSVLKKILLLLLMLSQSSFCERPIIIAVHLRYYRPQRSSGKVMFSQPSVILFTGGCGRRPLGRHPHRADPTPPRFLLQRTVRILLECILVYAMFFKCLWKIQKQLRLLDLSLIEYFTWPPSWTSWSSVSMKTIFGLAPCIPSHSTTVATIRAQIWLIIGIFF